MLANGVIQPVVLRRIEQGRYELIAGERRWRAAQHAGLLKIPAVLADVASERRLEVALVENLQREDLNPIDEAMAYRDLLEDHGYSQADLAKRLGRSPATIANSLRLLTLPKKVQERVERGELTMGHARALAGLSSPKAQKALAEEIVRKRLSVRETERRVAAEARATPTERRSAGRPVRDPNVAAAEETLQQKLGTKVRIVQSAKGAGRLEIHFYSDEELQRVYDLVAAASDA